jgi:hypothetical protein
MGEYVNVTFFCELKMSMLPLHTVTQCKLCSDTFRRNFMNSNTNCSRRLAGDEVEIDANRVTWPALS